jgi:hypothetical protein
MKLFSPYKAGHSARGLFGWRLARSQLLLVPVPAFLA